MANTDKSVYEIMCSVGYRDVKFFNLLFKKNFGATPSEYRKRLKTPYKLKNTTFLFA
ncbi:MAG: helix-turn-helix domain-containing protein [Clostridiales bacterium]|nr:MAG: helix-turn-helix domain-containing protein [Clostridiales bacterium]